MTVAARNPASSISTLFLIIVLLMVLAVGGLGGYIARAMTSPATPQHASLRPGSSVCPSGTHVSVWYTAGTWTCILGDS